MIKWLNTRSLKWKLWAYFVCFAAGIMLVLWLLQIIFLSAFYEQMKLRQVAAIGNQIADLYGTEEFDDARNTLSYRNGVMIMVVDKAGRTIANSDMFGSDRQQHINAVELQILLDRTAESESGRVSFTMKAPHIPANTAAFGAELSAGGEPIYLLVTSPLAPVDATTQVLQTQLLIVTVISLLMGFVLAYFIARKLSRPITKITHAATELATGDYSVVFHGGGYAEIDELASALNHTTQELSKTDELRRDLVANVSHDLRTPLTIIKSYAEMIRDISGDTPHKRQEHLQVIIDESDRLNALVSDLLDLSRMEAGTIQLHPEPMDLSEAVSTILRRFHVLSESEGYTFHADCQPGAIICADQQRMEQVVYNLISNAVNYTGADRKVFVHVHAADGRVRFSVSDTGKGIPPEEIKHIWERYYKASQLGHRSAKGTGIGLAIVKSILLAHDAKFGVDSTVGKGSTFWFEMPLVADASDSQ